MFEVLNKKKNWENVRWFAYNALILKAFICILDKMFRSYNIDKVEMHMGIV